MKNIEITKELFSVLKEKENSLRQILQWWAANKHYLEKQEYNILKSKNKRNAISIPLDNSNPKNTGSK